MIVTKQTAVVTVHERTYSKDGMPGFIRIELDAYGYRLSYAFAVSLSVGVADYATALHQFDALVKIATRNGWTET